MLVVGGVCDGQNIYPREYPPLPHYSICPPFPISLGREIPIEEARNMSVTIYDYASVELRWPSGSTKAWLLMPAEMTERERFKLLLERGYVDD